MVSFKVISTQSKRLFVVNFQSAAMFFFRFATCLTDTIVSRICFPALPLPVCAVIFNIATLPAIAIFTCHVLGLPISHTFTTTKVMSIYKSIATVKRFTAIITGQILASPSKRNQTTLIRACYTCTPFKALLLIWFDENFNTADNTMPGVFKAVEFIFARFITEPKSSFVALNENRPAVKFGVAMRTMYNHFTLHFMGLIIAQHWVQVNS